jgi:multidrug efflux pump subunit AcrA (membrane-fusion protein)
VGDATEAGCRRIEGKSNAVSSSPPSPTPAPVQWEACQRTRLSTISGGRIEVLAVKEGDRVGKGQLLMKLWNDDQQAQTAWVGVAGDHGSPARQ